jgi:hypothetical protein
MLSSIRIQKAKVRNLCSFSRRGAQCRLFPLVWNVNNLRQNAISLQIRIFLVKFTNANEEEILMNNLNKNDFTDTVDELTEVFDVEPETKAVDKDEDIDEEANEFDESGTKSMETDLEFIIYLLLLLF